MRLCVDVVDVMRVSCFVVICAGVLVCAGPARPAWAVTRGPRSDLTPESRLFAERGVALVQAGAYAEAVVEFERAYALLPDPLLHRTGRSEVLGSLRRVLVDLHAATGDPAHLERLRDHLLLYLEGLLVALGERATAEDAAGALGALRQVSATLAEQRPSPVVAAVGGGVQARPGRVVATAPRTAEGPRVASDARVPAGRRPGLVGAVLTGVGVVGVGVMTGMAIGVADSRGKLRGLTGSLEQPGSRASPRVLEEARGLHERAGVYRTVGVVSGVLGAAALASGVALLVVGKRRTQAQAHRRVAPLLGFGVVGAVFGGEF